jgi:hypothetical protein
MTETKSQKSATSGTKREGSVTLGYEYSICEEAQDFISEYQNYVDNYTLFIIKDSFRGFSNEMQKKMVEVLHYVFDDFDLENAVMVFPCTGIQHVDLLLSEIIYKINVSMDKFAYYER